jgi:hypothetical protein
MTPLVVLADYGGVLSLLFLKVNNREWGDFPI